MVDKLTIIIVNYKQTEYTVKCIQSILESSFSNFQILLIDNGATKEDHHNLKKKMCVDKRIITFRTTENLGYVGGINYALQKAINLHNGYILIMNNDTIIHKHAIKILVETCKQYQNYAIVTGKVYDYGTNVIQYVGDIFTDRDNLRYIRVGQGEVDNGQYDITCERDMIDDIFWLFPYDLITKIGGYSPLFYFNGESADFAFRAVESGYKLIYDYSAKLWHKGSISIGGKEMNPAKSYWIMQSATILRKLYLPKKNFRIFIIKTIRSIIISFTKNLFSYININQNTFENTKAKMYGFVSAFKILKKNRNEGYNPFI